MPFHEFMFPSLPSYNIQDQVDKILLWSIFLLFMIYDLLFMLSFIPYLSSHHLSNPQGKEYPSFIDEKASTE